MNRKDLQITCNAQLKEQDFKSQIYGFKTNYPEIFASNLIPSVCASGLIAEICRKPFRVWVRKYTELKMGGDNA